MKSLNRFLGYTGVALALAIGVVGCTKKSAEQANTLNTASVSKIKGLDPVDADDLYSATEVLRVYEPLLTYHYLKRPYQLMPLLAESMPEQSADGKTLTFHLKKGVVFQDDPAFKATNGKGREMTAEDVVYSYKRLADPKVTSSGFWLLDGKIVGLNEWRDAASKASSTDYAAVVEGLKATDRYTVQIKLIKPSQQFLYGLAMAFTSIVPREAVEMYGKEFLNHPVGTGPFRMEEYNPSSKIVYVKNPTYRKELYPSEGAPGDKEAGFLDDAGKPLPLVDRIVMTVFVEDQPRWLSFLSGRLDYSGIPKDNYSQAIAANGKELTPEMKAKNLRLQISPTLDITHDSFNMADPVVGKNKLLRQALSLAFDMGPSIELFYNGRALAAQGPIPPGLSGYDPEFKNPFRQYNLEKAKELLAKAGYPEGKGLAPIQYVTIANSTNRQMNEYLEKQMAAIGVKLKIDAFSWPEFSAAVKNKKGQMWGFAWSADYPDAENFLQLFYSKNVSPGPNDANYSNPEFDKLYEKSLALADMPERTQLYKDMVKILVEDCPWIFGVHRLQYDLTHPWLKNQKYHEFDLSRAKYFRIDSSLRK